MTDLVEEHDVGRASGEGTGLCPSGVVARCELYTGGEAVIIRNRAERAVPVGDATSVRGHCSLRRSEEQCL